MKLDFIADVTDGGKYPYADPVSLVRLYDFSQQEACRLRSLIASQLHAEGASLDLSRVDFIEAENCSLCFYVSQTDDGLITTNGKDFACHLTKKSYAAMVDLIEPFCERGASGYQWLYDLDHPIDLLFSAGGQW